MPPLRVLVVDDSVVIRKMISDILSQDPELEVAGSASDGKIALSMILQLSPDLVTLDIEMPVLNGLETLAEIRKILPDLPVIMFSTLTERGAGSTLEALSLGASDYVTKPSNTMSTDEARQRIRTEMIPKIKALCRRRGRDLAQRNSPTSIGGASVGNALAPSNVVTLGARPAAIRPASRPVSRKIEIVAIGTSTGGPNALGAALPGIPADIPVPIVIVQHMPPIFTRMLAERLASRCAIKVHEGTEGAQLEPGHAWIAPGDFHMTVARHGTALRLHLNQAAQENSCRPAVDVLFRSVAETCGAGALAVVMTGMGSDGMRGAQRIREAGGEVIVQDEKSSVVWGMPGFTFNEGHADAVYPLDQLDSEILRRVIASQSLAGQRARRELMRQS
jgi:two-component system chemotaxis response regulator CheB